MRANVTFASSNTDGTKEVLKNTVGKVNEIDEDGDALIGFQGIGNHWVEARKFGKLSVLSPEERVSM